MIQPQTRGLLDQINIESGAGEHGSRKERELTKGKRRGGSRIDLS